MQPLFPAITVALSRGMVSGGKLQVVMGSPEESADDPDDTDEDFTPLEKRDERWWRDFGADFDDAEPEPEPGDFWREMDDSCCREDGNAADARTAGCLAAGHLAAVCEVSGDEN